MENDIIAAHIVCTQGGRVVPAFRLQRSEAVDQIGYVFSGGIKKGSRAWEGRLRKRVLISICGESGFCPAF